MKIMIVASLSFAKEMLVAKDVLEKLGHRALFCEAVPHYSGRPETKDSFEDELKKAEEEGALGDGFSKVAESDAVLVLNYPKNNVAGYIGSSMLMEIGVAYFLNKKIYLLNPVGPGHKCALEIALVKPVILDGDINKIIYMNIWGIAYFLLFSILFAIG